MKVYFIGAGPGAPDLITLRGARLLGECRMVLYAGSLVSREMLAHCRGDAEIFDTAEMHLDAQVEKFQEAAEKGWDVARLHTGDPSIYGAIAEQMRRLDECGIVYEVVPGVSSFAAAAAALPAELTKPEDTQTVILSRIEGRTPVPEDEALEKLASHRASLCLFLSGGRLRGVVEKLLTHYPPGTPIALVQKASWPQQRVHRSTLARILDEVQPKEWVLSTMILVGNALRHDDGVDSKLYSAEFGHLHRRKSDEA